MRTLEGVPVEFGVLGRLEVVGGEGPIELRGRKRRALVGLLLAERGRVVSADRVVRHLWDDDPDSVVRVKGAIHELRRLFGADGDRLVTAPRGYSLQVAAGELDAAVFEELVGQAAATADRRGAVDLLTQALAHWRGAAFEEFVDADWAIGEASRLDAMRLRALEALVDAELDVGEHAQVVGRLEALVVEHPLRENFWAQLMVALYRCGRQAEALRAYQRVRHLLAEQLGISPSFALIELERRVLAQDPNLGWNPPDSGDLQPAQADDAVRPVGTVTFLFTDIEDSTRLWEDHPAAMAEALARHDEILTSEVKSRGGWIFSWGGDGLVAAAFQRAGNALDAAIDAQRQIRNEPWPEPVALRVRMALHTGEAQERDGNYYGSPLNRAARLLAVASGGQVVVSRATADVLGHHPQAELVDIGEHRLRGVAGVMHLFQVTAPGLPAGTAGIEAHDWPRPRAVRSGSRLKMSGSARPDADTSDNQVEAGANPLPAVLTRAVRSGTLVGRHTELERLLTIWSDVVGGRSRTVVVVGEAGIGKTRLAAEFALEVQSGGGNVLFGACHEDELRPFGPFGQLLDDALGAEAPTALDDPPWARLDAADAAAQQTRAVDVLVEHLAAFGRRRPTLLVVEDVHWATRTTRIALLEVVRHADGPGLMVAVTSRTGSADMSDDTAVMLGEIDKASGTARVNLGGLTAEDIVVIALRRDHDIDAEQLRAATGGNPLLVREVLDDPDRHSGSSVQGLLLSRTRRLSSADNDLLDTAAIIGDEFDVDVLADSVGLDVVDVVDTLARCESVGLVDAAGRQGRFAFAHSLFRSVRLGALPASRRLQLHHQVAIALSQRPPSSRTLPALARHACAAAPLGDRVAAVDYAQRAGDIFMDELAIDEAADMYRLALSVAETIDPPPVTMRCELLVRLGRAATDDPSSPGIVLDAAQTALALGRLDIVADAVWVMAAFRSAFSHDPIALPLVQQALAAAERDDPALRARLTCVLALQAPGLDDPERRHELMAQAIELARIADQPRLLAWVLGWNWFATFHPANLETRRQVEDELLTLARREHLPFFEIHARQMRCAGMLELGNLTGAAAEADEIDRS
jgi:class 3 adenylate cyclase